MALYKLMPNVMLYFTLMRIMSSYIDFTPDGILEGEEIFVVALTSTDNNADLSVTHRNADIIIGADPGSSGHIEVVPDYRQVIVAEPDALYDGRQVISQVIGTRCIHSPCLLI